jgi:general stress protein 26
MAYEEITDKSPAELAERAWDLAEDIRTCNLNTWDGKRLCSRPLSAIVRPNEHAVYFLVDVNGAKNSQLERYPECSLAFADTGSNKYVSLYGSGAVTNDRAKIRELWSDFMKAWWDGPESGDIRLLTFTPDKAELWDSPNRLIATALMLTAAVTGAKPSLGDHARVNV